MSLVKRSLQLVAVLVAAIVAAQDRPTLRIDIQEVHVDVEVLSNDRRIITGLTRGDFQVFDEGQQQTLVGFASEQQSLDVILLFDISSSMRSKLEKLTTAARQSLQELRQGDRVSVMTFADQTNLVCAFTSRLDSVERHIQDILSQSLRGRNTYLQQGVDDAGNYFRKHVRRRAILVITDNLGNRTRNEMSVVRNLWEGDVVLCGLTIRDPAYPVRRAIVAVVAPYVLGRVRGMDRIAEQTGGDTIRLDYPSSAFAEMMRRIRSRYSLYYSTPEGELGSFRKIRVELSRDAQGRFPEARVYARRGYMFTQQR